ncbi:hypothetical protein BNJ_00353 [Kaumoebavirus]|uniref:hypothetical protein n=1 Tax=Kaumoebavirus TaxID=1859492 RepID=UPI0009C31D5F|nr:hypothetical protein BNJ_00353 [Kaumoebavirus]ARA72173.1 hypothetical protein BNJ_00353 [Kaumoebavirus]
MKKGTPLNNMSLITIPTELQAEIFSYLSTSEKLNCSLLCKKFQGMILYSKASAAFWKILNADVLKKKQKYALGNISPEVLIDTRGLFKSSLQHFKDLREAKIGYPIIDCAFPNLTKLIIKTPRSIILPPNNFPKLRHLVINEANVVLSEIEKLPLHTLRLCGRISRGSSSYHFPALRYLEIRNFQVYLPYIEAPNLLGLRTLTMDNPRDSLVTKKYEGLEFTDIVDVLEDDTSEESKDFLMKEWRERYTLRYDAGGILDPFEVKGNFYV